jgi:hypothetical protein
LSFKKHQIFEVELRLVLFWNSWGAIKRMLPSPIKKNENLFHHSFCLSDTAYRQLRAGRAASGEDRYVAIFYINYGLQLLLGHCNSHGWVGSINQMGERL